MKKIASIILAVLLVFSISACGAAKNASEAKKVEMAGGAREEAEYDTAVPAEEPAAQYIREDSKVSQNAGVGRKIIYNANAEIDVKDLKGTYDSIISRVEGIGGYIASSGITDNYSEITARIPSEKLDEFIKYLETLGEGNNRIYRNSDDITEQYTDTESRLRNYKAQEEQLLEVLDKAETVEDILKVQNELFRVRGEIEALEGSIKMWDRLVELSTVTVRLNKIREIGEKEVKITFITLDEIVKGMANGFKSTLNFIIRFISGVFIYLVSIIPALPFIALALWLLNKLRKKITGRVIKGHMKNNSDNKNNNNNNSNE